MKLDLRRVAQPEQAITDLVGDVFQFRVPDFREPGGGFASGDRNDDAEDVAELVVDERTPNAVGQVALRPFDFAPHAVPDRAHVLVRLFDVDVNDGETGLRLAVDEIELRHFLDGFFDLVRDQILHAFWTRAREEGLDHRGADDEARVFGLRQREECIDARDEDHPERDERDAIVLDGEARDIHRSRASLRPPDGRAVRR